MGNEERDVVHASVRKSAKVKKSLFLMVGDRKMASHQTPQSELRS